MGTKRVTPKKPKARVLRLLKAKEPKLVEDGKQALFLKGTKCPQLLQTVLRDLTKLLKPNAKFLSRKNEIRPFEDVISLEFLADKNDCALFCFGSHSKKRPQNLIIGRTYDKHLLDMVEFGVSSVEGLDAVKATEKKRCGSKPCLIFAGDGWHQDATLERIQNLFMDFFRVDEVNKVALAGIDAVTSFTAMGTDSILVRNYHVKFKKSQGRVPNVLLEAMGPNFTLTVRRHQLAAPDLWRTACKQPKGLRPKKVKNESTNVLGETVGRVHVGRQDLASMRVKRVKALRKGRGEREEGEAETGDGVAEGGAMDESDEGEYSEDSEE
ncbi:hypothetical protein NSK_005928 [Nannochloropsis salina CCMP1776]|uniref:Ribosome production factor 2 homolog n=1 Tax=Nannochloropsis salina CCMP1776 TaxID=1027361 RepID=A0A4D9CZC9_9STRA|nr:hypothetical protein NSK_005928 [Nannochloropsis salina CCMP1776]|eukprot:TFJ82735.1 hypothetical protein NSK_005928 [Nannochloropsis salina CCMP1776]